MALDNLRCPQFVDFTNRATFDIHDGADVYFGKRTKVFLNEKNYVFLFRKRSSRGIWIRF